MPTASKKGIMRKNYKVITTLTSFFFISYGITFPSTPKPSTVI